MSRSPHSRRHRQANVVATVPVATVTAGGPSLSTAETSSSGAPLPVFIGQTAGYASAADPINGQLLAVRDWLESRYGSCRVTHLSAYVSNAVGNMRLALYADTGSERPGAKVCETAEFTPTAGWNKVAVTSPTVIATGTYWVAVQASSSSLTIGTQSSAGIGFSNGARQVQPYTYQAMPATFPTTTAQFDSYHFSVYATLESQSLTMPADPATPATPTPLVGQGYSLAFQDEFDWYNREVWNNLIWYDSPPFNQNSIYCQDSILHLVTKKPPGWTTDDPYSLVNVSTLGRLDFTDGYFEARMNWPGHVGAWPAYWLISRDWAYYSSCAINQACEIDMFEGVGDDTSGFYGTCHRDSSEACQTNIQNSNNYTDLSPTVLADNWRTYAVWWTPTSLKWYVDNSLVSQVAIGPSTSWTEMEQPMQLLIWNWTHSNAGGWGTAIDGTVSSLDTQVDWVRVWQA